MEYSVIGSGSGRLVLDPPARTKKHIRQSEWKRVAYLELDEGILNLYRWFIKKRYNLKLTSPLRSAHLTIINDKGIDDRRYSEIVEAYKGFHMDYSFSRDVQTDGLRWWFPATCKSGQELRKALGLNPEPYYPFHITIGNVYGRYLVHGEYIRKVVTKFGKEYN